jgi:hypothetical protein
VRLHPSTQHTWPQLYACLSIIWPFWVSHCPKLGQEEWSTWKLTSAHAYVRKTVFSIKVCHHLSCLQFGILVHWAPFLSWNYYLSHLQIPSVALANWKQIVYLNSTWTGNSFWAWIISATRGERTYVCTAVTKKVCAQTKEGKNAIDWQSIPWWSGRILGVVWEWRKCVWDTDWVWRPYPQFCRYPGDYIQLNSSPYGPHWGLILLIAK